MARILFTILIAGALAGCLPDNRPLPAGNGAPVVSAAVPTTLTAAVPAATPAATPAAPAGAVASTTPPVPPSIFGTPPTSVVAGTNYNFTPTTSAAAGTAMTFSIQNKPTWAVFDTQTGILSGTPSAADVGRTSGIVIQVADAQGVASLPAFNVDVTQISTGSATLAWVAPTQNTDGSALLNLAGFRIYYGPSNASLTQTIDVKSAGIASYVIGNLGAATWYFTVKAYNAAGVESGPSAIVSKTIP